MATREITDEQAGEIAEILDMLKYHYKCGCIGCRDDGLIALAEIRRLLGFPA